MRRRVELVAMSTAFEGGARFQRLLQIALTLCGSTANREAGAGAGKVGVESQRFNVSM